MWQDSFTCVTGLVYMCWGESRAHTRCMRHDSQRQQRIQTCATWLIDPCVTWHIHTCLGESRVEKDPYGRYGFIYVALLHICVTWLIHICVRWLIHIHVTWLIHACVTWLIHACVTWHIHTCVGVSRVEKAPYGRDTCEWLIHICDMTHSHVWHDSFTHMWRDSFTHMWHDTFIRV